MLVPCVKRDGKPRWVWGSSAGLIRSSHAPSSLIYSVPGILPHDGKNIKFTELTEKIRATYNFAPSFCFFVPNFAANMLKRNYRKDTFDLADLDLHNGIEHDASLTRTYCFVVDGLDLGGNLTLYQFRRHQVKIARSFQTNQNPTSPSSGSFWHRLLEKMRTAMRSSQRRTSPNTPPRDASMLNIRIPLSLWISPIKCLAAPSVFLFTV